MNFNLRNPRNRIQNNRILALLRQRRTKPTANLNRESHIRHAELPIGWEVSIVENGSKTYQETSIGSNIDALTFEQPCAGFLDDKRLVIGALNGEKRYGHRLDEWKGAIVEAGMRIIFY